MRKIVYLAVATATILGFSSLAYAQAFPAAPTFHYDSSGNITQLNANTPFKLTGFTPGCLESLAGGIATSTGSACGSGGGGGGGISSTTPWTTLNLLQLNANGSVNTIATSSLGLTTSSFASSNISQWTNNSNYITLSALSAGYPLSYNSGTGAFSIVATSSENCTVTCFLSHNVSQWTNDAGYLTSAVTSVGATYPILSSGGNTPTISTAIATSTLIQVGTTSVASITTLPSLSLPYAQLTGTPATSVTVNSVPCTLGSTCTVTAASSTLLSNNNTFSGNNLFSASTTFSNIVNLNQSSTSLATFANLYDSALTSGNCVQASTGGLLTTTGSACGTGSGTVTSVTASAPLFSSGGTTPNITWAGIATTSNLVSGQVLASNGGAGVYSTATSTASCSGSVSCTTFNILGSSPITITGNDSGTVTAVTGTWPITSSGGTTPNITWSGIASSTNLVTSDVWYSTGVNTFGQVGTSSFTNGTGISVTGNGYAIGSSPTITNTGVITCAGTYPIACSGTNPATVSTSFGTTTNAGIGNNLILYTSNSGVFQGAASSSLDLPNGALQNSSITVNTASPLGGGSSVNLGGTLNLTCSTCVTSVSAFPFITATNYGTTTSATSTPIWDTVGLYASSTSQFQFASTTALTVTGNEYFSNLSSGAVSSNGTFLQSGTLSIANGGTNQTAFGQGWVYATGGSTALAASTSPTVNYWTATSTSATSTAAYSINLTSGCFAINGSCLSSGSISSVSNSDGSLTFSPTTGAVVGSLNLAHSNIFTVPQSINTGSIGTTFGQGLNLTQTNNVGSNYSPALTMTGIQATNGCTGTAEPSSWSLYNVLTGNDSLGGSNGRDGNLQINSILRGCNGDYSTTTVLSLLHYGTDFATTTALGVASSTPFGSGISVGSGTASSSITVAEYKYGANGNVATSTTQNIDCNAANQIAEPILGSAMTFTLINLTPGKSCRVVVQNGNTAASTITWKVQVGILMWSTGTAPLSTTAPTAPTTANDDSVWSFITTSGSTTYETIGALTQ